MKRTTNTITISLPQQMLKQVKKAVQEEGRTKSELFREALRRYLEDQEWKSILRYGRKKAIESGITEDQIEDIVDEYRK